MNSFEDYVEWVLKNLSGKDRETAVRLVAEYRKTKRVKKGGVRSFDEIYERWEKGFSVKIDLIKLYRNAFECSLTKAKVGIERHEIGSRFSQDYGYDWESLERLLG